MADAVMALAIVALLGASMSVALGRQARASRRLADERAATWAAERAMAQLQAGVAKDGEPQVDGAGVAVEPAGGAAAPAGHAWVRVRADVNGRRAALVGLVPADAVRVPEPGDDAGAAGHAPNVEKGGAE